MENCLAYFEEILQNPDVIAGLPRSIVKLSDYEIEFIKSDAGIVVIKEPVEDEYSGGYVTESKEYTFQELAEINVAFEKNKVLSKISNYSYSLDDKELSNFLKRSMQHINYLLSRHEVVSRDSDKSSFIKTALTEIREELNVRFVPVDMPSSALKIQWLGPTNLLTTLIYDLWQGQDKGSRKERTRALIKTTKGDLMKLLMGNFIDVEGNSLKDSTLSDYLSTSENKSNSKAKIGARIELELPD